MDIRQRIVEVQKSFFYSLKSKKLAILLEKFAENIGVVPSSYLSRKYVTVVSGMRMSRDMESIIRGAEDAKVVVFPRSVKRVGESAFEYTKLLRQVVVNEGLERLWMCTDPAPRSCGPFSFSPLERIRLPSTLKALGFRTFSFTKELKQVELPEGLEAIGDECFSSSGVQILRIPASVKRIGR